jgi:hypothetical protein
MVARLKRNHPKPRGGKGKRKGSKFERVICKLFSRWVSGGKREDLFWRSAMSGGRATVARGKVRQSGDLTAVAPEGHVLTDYWFIECKTGFGLSVGLFLLRGMGPLAKFWKVARREAVKYGKEPMLVARQSGLPTIVVMPYDLELDEILNIWFAAGPIVKDRRARWVVFKLDDLLKVDYERLGQR